MDRGDAKLRYPASLEDVDFSTPRGLHRDAVLSLWHRRVDFTMFALRACALAAGLALLSPGAAWAQKGGSHGGGSHAATAPQTEQPMNRLQTVCQHLVDAVLYGITVSEIRDPDFGARLPDALDAAFALLKTGRVPGKVDVDERAQALEVQSL
jgi:hypothetical protein